MQMIPVKDQMLVRVKVGFWRGKKKSDRLSEEAARKHKADADYINTTLSLLSREDAKRLACINSTARNILKNYAMPYDGIWRRTTTAIYPKIARQMADLERDARDTVQEIANRWDAIVTQSKKRLPGLVNDCDFPATGEQFKERFQFSFTVGKMPDAQSLTFDLPKQEVERIRAAAQEEQAEAIQNGNRWLAEFACDIIKPLAESVKNGTVRASACRSLERCAEFLKNNGAEDKIVAGVIKMRDSIRAVAHVKKAEPAVMKAADAVLDELANFGR